MKGTARPAAAQPDAGQPNGLTWQGGALSCRAPRPSHGVGHHRCHGLAAACEQGEEAATLLLGRLIQEEVVGHPQGGVRAWEEIGNTAGGGQGLVRQGRW